MSVAGLLSVTLPYPDGHEAEEALRRGDGHERGHRETGSRRARLDRISALARISTLRKKSRRAGMNVAAGVLRWDRRRVPGPTERPVRRRLVLESSRHLTKNQRRLMLTTMTGWGNDRPSQMFITAQVAPERLSSSSRPRSCAVHRGVGTPRRGSHLCLDTVQPSSRSESSAMLIRSKFALRVFGEMSFTDFLRSCARHTGR